ncbi:hypothetical protein P43SY_007337 [Pythium insidiosum]|uniref:Transmembrane protein n=1 Tax=Pythium insidiosum TaxID=114742 RepID=A0AAD5QD50_PYTIN|nr:hypothetical protein P43SY_007337 [Pythium insidiosum]
MRQSQPSHPTRASSATSGRSDPGLVLLEHPHLYSYRARCDLETEAALTSTLSTGSQSQARAAPVAVTARPSASPALLDATTTLHFFGHSSPQLTELPKDTPTTAPDQLTVEHGAIRPGGAVDLREPQYVGMLVNWALIGLCNGALPGVIFPLFFSYLRLKSYQISAVHAVLSAPWYFKFAIGFVTDSVPINRQRRKPYVCLGWTLSLAFMAMMSGMQHVEPHTRGNEIVNPSAPEQGLRFLLPMVLGSLGHLITSVACEGMLIELAQREGERVRGHTLCVAFIYRFSGEVLGCCFVALGLNGPDFGGTFASSVPLRMVFAVLAVVSLAGLVVSVRWLEDPVLLSSRQPIKSQLRRIWSIVQCPTTWQIMVFGFLHKSANTFEVHETSSILRVWLDSGSLVLGMRRIFPRLGVVLAAGVTSRYLLQTNWRLLTVVSVIAAVVVGLSVELLTAFDVVRSLPIEVLKDVIVNLADGFTWLVRGLVVIEITDVGFEATTYGFITTVYNLASAVVTTSTSIAATAFPDDYDEQDLQDDTMGVRWHIATQVVVKYSLRLAVGVLALPLLPRQKRHAKERLLRNHPGMVAPLLLFLGFLVLLVATMTATMLALFPSTACLRFAGGSGCS